MNKPPYRYQGQITRVIDGDTVDIVIDLGLRITANVRARLWGINTPERGQQGYNEAGDYLIFRTAGKTLAVETHKDPDNFGRWLIVLIDDSGKCINDDMVTLGHAVEYRR